MQTVRPWPARVGCGLKTQHGREALDGEHISNWKEGPRDRCRTRIKKPEWLGTYSCPIWAWAAGSGVFGRGVAQYDDKNSPNVLDTCLPPPPPSSPASLPRTAAAMASASRRRAEKARMPSDTFRPKFPVDPFAAATVREPWFVRPEALPSIAYQAKRDVILVLGGEHPFILGASTRLTPVQPRPPGTSTRS